MSTASACRAGSINLTPLPSSRSYSRYCHFHRTFGCSREGRQRGYHITTGEAWRNAWHGMVPRVLVSGMGRLDSRPF